VNENHENHVKLIHVGFGLLLRASKLKRHG
jgi:hypothetical protein